MKIVAYYRVSTHRQKKSGLGLAAQRKVVKDFATKMGYTVVAEYQETESGTDVDRPVLAEAIQHTQSIKGILVIAKLDRLSRNLALVAKLLDNPDLEFVCCDNPVANRLTIQVLAAVAEEEARQISTRTRAALAVAKSKGKKLGSARPGHWEGREHLRGWRKGAEKSAELRSKRAEAAYGYIYKILKKMQSDGFTYQKMVEELNKAGHTTTTGNPFNAPTVCRIFKRFEKSA